MKLNAPFLVLNTATDTGTMFFSDSFGVAVVPDYRPKTLGQASFSVCYQTVTYGHNPD
jgi:hypothetical protein